VVSIRRIRADEGEVYRAVRLAALREAPEAFCSTYADALVRSDESWREQVEENATGEDCALFLAFAEDAAIGLAGIYRDEADREKGELCQVWVAPTHRHAGVAIALMDAVIAWAEEREFRRTLATIRGGNERALRFYRHYGFQDAKGESGPLPGDTVLVWRIGANEDGVG